MSKEQFDSKAYRREYMREYRKQAHTERLSVECPKDNNLKQRIKAVADRQGLSINQWVIRALEKELEWYE